MTDRTKNELYSIFKNMSASLVMIVISMTGFWLMQGRELVTRHEVVELINTTGPYIEDQGMIRSELATLHATDQRTSVVLDKAMDVLSDLRVEIGRLNTTLQDLNEDRNGQNNN